MDINYLLSVLDLYLLKEQNGNLIIEVDNLENLVKVNFSYSFDYTNKTYVKIAKSLFLEALKEILEKVQANSDVLKEELTDDNKESVYTFFLQNERRISFINFSEDERKVIRSNFKNLKEEVKLKIDEPTEELIIEDSYNDIYEQNKKTRPAFSFGFATYITLFLTTIWILDVLMIALLIFKLFIK